MAQYSFGSGALWGTSTKANATPIQVAGLQNVSVDITFTQKELYGSYQYPVAIGRGTSKIAGKASFASFTARILNDLFFGNAADPAVGEELVAIAESAPIPASPFQITPANAADFSEDLGVTYAVTGKPLSKVASSPATGEYSVNPVTGVYTFAAADTGLGVRISYKHTSATTGRTIELTNNLLGSASFFSAVLTTVYQGKALTLKLNRCMSSKFTLPYKLEDFTIADFEFAAFADDSNSVGSLSMAE